MYVRGRGGEWTITFYFDKTLFLLELLAKSSTRSAWLCVFAHLCSPTWPPTSRSTTSSLGSKAHTRPEDRRGIAGGRIRKAGGLVRKGDSKLLPITNTEQQTMNSKWQTVSSKDRNNKANNGQQTANHEQQQTNSEWQSTKHLRTRSRVAKDARSDFKRRQSIVPCSGGPAGCAEFPYNVSFNMFAISRLLNDVCRNHIMHFPHGEIRVQDFIGLFTCMSKFMYTTNVLLLQTFVYTGWCFCFIAQVAIASAAQSNSYKACKVVVASRLNGRQLPYK